MPRMLIVDDDAGKTARIIDCAKDAGFDDASIVAVGCTNDAKRILTSQKFDLLLVDLFVPTRNGEPPSKRSGSDLIRDIGEYDSLIRPTYIIGLSQYSNLVEEFTDFFKDQLLSLELYSDSDNSWLKRLRARLDHLVQLEKQSSRKTYLTDICIIAALHSLELTAVLSLDWNWQDPKALDDCSLYYTGQVNVDGRELSVVAAAATRMGMISTAILSTKMIMKFRPKLLAMVGICAGYEDSCGLGDVLVATSSWDWQSGKYKKGVFEIAPEQIDAPRKVESRLQILKETDVLQPAHDLFSGAKPATRPEFRVGPVVSGSSVLADRNKMNDIKIGQHRKLLGVDMEIFGLYSAAKDCGEPTPLTFAIKAVSDAGNANKSDDYQRYAAHISAHALDLIIRKFHTDFIG